MKIVLTGGGSGGHITPLLAVAHELKQLQPDVTLVYIGQRGDSLSDIPAAHPDIDEVYSVRAGKFRRYHGEGIKQILDVPTGLKNFRDAGRVIRGLNESYRLLKRLKPDLVFIKGGFVGVPVGLSAARLRIPFVTHDSDALPGLANRIIARWAAVHAVALPKEIYGGYPAEKTVTVGVPVSELYQPVTVAAKQAFREALGLQAYDPMLFVTGGGNGAEVLNDAVAGVVPQLLEQFPKLVVVQAAGRLHESKLQAYYQEKISDIDQSRVIVKGYIEDMYRYCGAADVIVTRAGATTLAEFAVQGKACIIVPNPRLTGGHQVKNAVTLVNRKAIKLLPDEDLVKPEVVLRTIAEVLASKTDQAALGSGIQAFAHPHAARELAELLLKTLSYTRS